MVLFPKAMLSRFFMNSLGYSVLQGLTNSVFPLAAADKGPQVDAVIITEAGFQKARTRQAQAVAGRTEGMGIGGNEANTALQIPALVIRSRPIAPPFSRRGQVRIGPEQEGQGCRFR